MRFGKAVTMVVLVITGLMFSACPVRTGPIIVDIPNRRATIPIIIEPFSSNDFSSSVVTNTSGIFDLSNPWVPDMSTGSVAIVKVKQDSGQVVQSSFPTQLDVNSNVDPVDKDTTPHVYTFQNPNDVNGFIAQSLAGQSDSTIEIEFLSTFYQASCSIPSGDYINHVRYLDSSGISYVLNFTLEYAIPDNVQGENSCEQATISIKE